MRFVIATIKFAFVVLSYLYAEPFYESIKSVLFVSQRFLKYTKLRLRAVNNFNNENENDFISNENTFEMRVETQANSVNISTSFLTLQLKFVCSNCFSKGCANEKKSILNSITITNYTPGRIGSLLIKQNSTISLVIKHQLMQYNFNKPPRTSCIFNICIITFTNSFSEPP